MTTCEDSAMIWLTIVVTLFLFGYLLVALLRPEKF
ncbi:MAG TPA: K(+)-transporting ATPase subunit F [Gemmataceae bacterium]|nr:K(+)-transporting ATPase subunit F [Gemmataceae bacterium]